MQSRTGGWQIYDMYLDDACLAECALYIYREHSDVSSLTSSPSPCHRLLCKCKVLKKADIVLVWLWFTEQVSRDVGGEWAWSDLDNMYLLCMKMWGKYSNFKAKIHGISVCKTIYVFKFWIEDLMTLVVNLLSNQLPWILFR